MPYDGQGVFTRVMNWQDDAANDISILASRHDAEDDNFANGFNEVLCRDGRAAMTGNLKMGTNKITGLANGTTDNDAVNLSQLNAMSSTLNTAINTAVTNVFSNLYPVGSVYIGTQATCPLASLLAGSTWTLVSSGKALWTGDGTNGNSTISAGLPDHYHFIANADNGGSTTVSLSSSNYMTQEGGGSPTSHYVTYRLNGTNTAPTKGRTSSPSNNLYGASSTVQPPAYVVNVWRRTA